MLLADGVVVDGIGARSSGRAGTNIAHSDNGAVLLDNAAGLIKLNGNGLFELGLDGSINDLDYSDPENSTNGRFDFPENPSGLPHIVYVTKSADCQWAYGLGMFVPAGFGTKYHLTNPLLGRNEYRSLGALIKILPAVSYQLTDRISIGGTFGLAVSHVEVESPFFFQTGLLANTPTLLDVQGTGVGTTGSLGLQYQLSERTTLGLAFISESRFEMEGEASVDVFGFGPGPVNTHFDAEVDFVWPRTVGFGLKHDLSECHRLSADVIWFDWSHAFDRLDVKFTDPTHPGVAAVTGPRVRDRVPLNWDDSVSLRLGYEYFPSPCEVYRAGYAYHDSPVPSSTLTPLIPATLEHGFALGYGRRIGHWMLDIAYAFVFGPAGEVSNSALVGGDFDNSRVKSQVHTAFISLSCEF